LPVTDGHPGKCVLSSAWVKQQPTADDYPLFPNRSTILPLTILPLTILPLTILPLTILPLTILPLIFN